MKNVSKENAVKAYKVFNSDWTCRDFKYEVGKEYSIDGEISLCNNGFHACIKTNDCFNYYDFNSENKVAEVLLWGDVDGLNKKGDKICSSNIEIIKEISWQEVLELVNTGKNNTGRCNSGDSNSGDWNSGDSNSGDSNSGDRNSGDRNSGDRNSGDWNSGDRNSGHRNSGDWNSGDWNSGDSNSGDSNSGDRNSGHRNSGDRNSGDWNSCDKETGFFNSEESEFIRVFNKKCKLSKFIACEKPNFIYFDLTTFVFKEEMSDVEKEKNPSYKTTGGYLKSLTYKEAWRESWNQAKIRNNWESEYKLLLDLPNFDAKVFEEITGIDPIKEK